MNTQILALSPAVEALLRDAIEQGERAYALIGTPDRPMLNLKAVERQLEALDEEIEYQPQVRARQSRKERSGERHDLRRRRISTMARLKQAQLDSMFGPESALEMDEFLMRVYRLLDRLVENRDSSARLSFLNCPDIDAAVEQDAAICRTVQTAMHRFNHPDHMDFDSDETRFRRLLDVLKLVLDAPQRAERIRLEQSAGTLGVRTDGLTNEELRQRIDRQLWADMMDAEAGR